MSIVLVSVAIPRNFPHHGLPPSLHEPKTFKQSFSRAQFRRVDFLGTALLLSATIFLVTALEEADVQYAWDSAFVIVVLALSAISWIAFLAWSRRVTRIEGKREPVFPWRFVTSRVCIGLLMYSSLHLDTRARHLLWTRDMVLTGAPFTVAVIQIPLKFQTVYGLSPLRAGIRLLPFAIASPIGSGIAAGLAGRAKIPPIYLMLVGSAIQIAGFTLLSTTPTTQSISNALYGYETIAGFAVGVNLACLILMTPFVVEKRDKCQCVGLSSSVAYTHTLLAVAMSATIQFRTMGGAIGLAVVTTATNTYIKKHLADYLSSAQIGALLQTTEAFTTLSPATADIAKTVFAQGYNLQMRIMIGFSAAQIPLTCLMWQKKQILI